MDIWSWLWAGWLGAYGAIEGVTIAGDDRGDTLSEHDWKWFGIGRHDGPRTAVTGTVGLRRFVLLAFCVWLSAHFLTGGFFQGSSSLNSRRSSGPPKCGPRGTQGIR